MSLTLCLCFHCHVFRPHTLLLPLLSFSLEVIWTFYLNYKQLSDDLVIPWCNRLLTHITEKQYSINIYQTWLTLGHCARCWETGWKLNSSPSKHPTSSNPSSSMILIKCHICFTILMASMKRPCVVFFSVSSSHLFSSPIILMSFWIYNHINGCFCPFIQPLLSLAVLMYHWLTYFSFIF